MKTISSLAAFSILRPITLHAFAVGPRPLDKAQFKLAQEQRVMGAPVSPLSFFHFGEYGDDPDRFVKEIFQMEKISADTTKYDSLVQYVKEWSHTLLTTSGSGLTTPISVEPTDEGVLITFVPKRPTGKKYTSKDEEKELEKKSQKEFEKKGRQATTALKEMQEEGGLEIYVLKNESLSVHAKRFNYGEDVAVKEMSEETIVNKLKDALISWKAELK